MSTSFLHTCFLMLMSLVMQPTRLMEAQSLHDTKSYNASIIVCSGELGRIGKTDPLYAKFLTLRADDYTETGNNQAAIADYKALIAIQPKVNYYLSLSVLYGSAKNYTDCLLVLKSAYKKYPKSIPVVSNLSYYCNEAGKFDDGLQYAEIGLVLNPDKFQQSLLLTNVGYAFLGQRKYDAALVEFNRAIPLNPNNAFAYCFRAVADIKLNYNMSTVCDDLAKAKRLGGVDLTDQLIKDFCSNTLPGAKKLGVQ